MRLLAVFLVAALFATQCFAFSASHRFQSLSTQAVTENVYELDTDMHSAEELAAAFASDAEVAWDEDFSAINCAPYSQSMAKSVKGNTGMIEVVPVQKVHLTNPAIYGQGMHQADNHIATKTVCAFVKMHNAAKAAGVSLTINSAFRTYERQVYFWNCYQTKKCNNGNVAARPGTSNHGTGIALDIQTGGSTTKIYQWLKKHAHSYGFVRTVKSETWHWEYRPGAPPAPYT